MRLEVTALYDAKEYLIAGLENQAEWWEHLGDAHRDYAELARAATSLEEQLEVERDIREKQALQLSSCIAIRNALEDALVNIHALPAQSGSIYEARRIAGMALGTKESR